MHNLFDFAQQDCYFILMRVQHGHKEDTLPHFYQKSVSLHSIYDLIRKKKQQLSKKLIPDDDDVHINLPKIHRMREERMVLQQQQDQKTVRESLKQRLEKITQTPAGKYRTILNLGSISQQKVTAGKQLSHLQLESRQKDKQFVNNVRKANFSHQKRVKTEAVDISPKATNNTQLQSPRNRDSEQTNFIKIEQAKEQFMNAILSIPKSMKMRNESNLMNVVKSLQIFNPFANRNHRIVNVCLFKMGKPLIVDSSLLYKIGEQLSCFYIILLGKVKLMNGALKKVCQAGETVLEQVIFSQRQRKIALERAKTIGKTVLLEISMQGMNRLKEELTRFGYRLGYQEMETIIKRNYIVKNWLRNKIKLQANR